MAKVKGKAKVKLILSKEEAKQLCSIIGKTVRGDEPMDKLYVDLLEKISSFKIKRLKITTERVSPEELKKQHDELTRLMGNNPHNNNRRK